MCEFRFNKSADIRRTLQKVSDLVAHDKMDTKKANTILYACQIALSVRKFELEVDEVNDDRGVSIDMGFSKQFEA